MTTSNTYQGAVERLQGLIRIPTVSYREWERVDTDAFDALLKQLEKSFPLVHSRLEVIRVRSHGLLLRWAGLSAQRPLVLMAHLDVVPVVESAPWQHPPFSAEIHDGSVWGRGTLDDKNCVAAVCEAVEALLAADYTPPQDVWLSFGCDEEVSGGAAEDAVRVLRDRGVQPWMVIDEGGAIAHGAFPGVEKPVAAIGVTEKGTTSIELSVSDRGGHASTPSRNGPTVRLAKAVTKVDRAPFPSRLPAPTIEMLKRLAPHAPRALAPLMARADRLRPLLTRALIAGGPESAAMVRTTVAVTTLEGSPALNVIASEAKAGLNVRVMVGDTVADVVEHITKTINDEHVHIDLVEAGEPSPISPHDDDAFALLTETIGELFEDALVSPYVMMAATDSRFFTEICQRVYRFAPFRMTKEQRQSVHSYDEHIRIDDYLAGIAWYRLLIERLPA